MASLEDMEQDPKNVSARRIDDPCRVVQQTIKRLPGSERLVRVTTRIANGCIINRYVPVDAHLGGVEVDNDYQERWQYEVTRVD